MSSAISYSGINTKVKAMSTRFITRDDYEKMVNLDSVADFIAYLKKHPGYSELFQKYDEREVHREEAERVFINALYLDYTSIYRFTNEEQRQDLELIFFRYEVNVLKTIIRLIHNHENTYDLSVFHPFFSKHSQINVSTLSSSRTMEEYVQNLKGTEYYSILSKLQSKNTNLTSFDYEMHLDVYYFTKSWRLKDKMLKGDNRKAFTHRMGTEIDLLNIMWIYRSKRNYDMNSADIFTYLIPVNYKLTKSQLARLVTCGSVDEFTNLLNTTRYKFFYKSLREGTLEIDFNNYINKIYQINVKMYPDSMSTVSYFLYRKDMEIARLTTAVECTRYRLDTKDKLKYILQE
jgi:V/A-type H+/Na+-transporting ATPase subunit C